MEDCSNKCKKSGKWCGVCIMKCEFMHPKGYHAGYSIRIEFRVEEDEHTGYCSCPDETDVAVTEETGVYPLPRVFTKADIKKGKIDCDDARLKKVYEKSFKNEGHCVCCYAKRRWIVKSAEIIKNGA